MGSKVEGEDPTYVDVGLCDRRDLPENFVWKLLRRLPHDGLHLLSVPGHHDVGQRRQRAGNRRQLLRCAAALGADAAGVDFPFEGMHGFALIEQAEDFRADRGIAEIVAQVEGRSASITVLSSGNPESLGFRFATHPPMVRYPPKAAVAGASGRVAAASPALLPDPRQPRVRPDPVRVGGRSVTVPAPSPDLVDVLATAYPGEQ